MSVAGVHCALMTAGSNVFALSTIAALARFWREVVGDRLSRCGGGGNTDASLAHWLLFISAKTAFSTQKKALVSPVTTRSSWCISPSRISFTRM